MGGGEKQCGNEKTKHSGRGIRSSVREPLRGREEDVLVNTSVLLGESGTVKILMSIHGPESQELIR